jgi:Tol biopolymer transport system component
MLFALLVVVMQGVGTQLPEGNRMMFTTGRLPDKHVFWWDLRTGLILDVTKSPYCCGAWSPDSQTRALLLFNGGEGGFDIAISNASGLNLRRLTNTPRRLNLDPVWSPDGDQVAFISTRDRGQEIYVVEVRTRSEWRLTADDYHDEDPVWSPDGQRIAYVSVRNGNSELWVMDANGRNQRSLPVPRRAATSPAWSPDSQRIVFTAGGTEVSDLYVINMDGSGLRQLTHHAWGQSSADPVWSPDGLHIYYLARAYGTQEIYRIKPDGTALQRMTYNQVKEEHLQLAP